MSDTKNIFSSHVHEDDGILQDLKSLLRDKGYEIRDSSIDSSKPNEAADENYIKSGILAPRIQWAGVTVVLISPDTHNSRWVDWEIEYAQKQDKRIIGVWVRGAQESDLPKSLELYADAVVGWQGDRVIDAIEGQINNWFKSNGEERSPRNIPRYSKLVYAMKVSETLTFDEYWNDPRFSHKKPNLRGSLKQAYGDNIYHRHPTTRKWLQENSHHSHADGRSNAANIRHDTQAPRVLLASKYAYFGGSGPVIPTRFRQRQGINVCCQRGHKCNFPNTFVVPLIKWIKSLGLSGFISPPKEFKV